MKGLIKLLFMLLMLSACIKNKTQKSVNFDMPEGELIELNHQCQELQKHGDVLTLFQEIDLQTQEVFSLLESSDPLSLEPEITALVSGISQKSKAVMALTKNVWSTPIWNHSVSWRIDEEDFKGVWGTNFANGFWLQGQEIHSVYLMGEKRDDLKSHITSIREGNTIIVTYTNLGSTLELCQLQKTMSIILNVRYKSLGLRKKGAFNLNVQHQFGGAL